MINERNDLFLTDEPPLKQILATCNHNRPPTPPKNDHHYSPPTCKNDIIGLHGFLFWVEISAYCLHVGDFIRLDQFEDQLTFKVWWESKEKIWQNLGGGGFIPELRLRAQYLKLLWFIFFPMRLLHLFTSTCRKATGSAERIIMSPNHL